MHVGFVLYLFILCIYRVRSLRERIQESKSHGVPRQEDSSLGTIEGLLKRGVATPEQIINAISNQKVRAARVSR